MRELFGRRGRTAVMLAVLAVGAVVYVEPVPPSAAAAPAGGPNVVLVLVDDLDETTTPYWDALPGTRQLIADRGLTFTNAFVTDPVCCPARATFLTGRYPHNTGVFDNSWPDGGHPAFARGAEADTVATRLQARGYATAFVGKYLNGYRGDTVPPGWDEWFGLTDFYWFGYNYGANHNGVRRSFGTDPADYSTDVVSQVGNDFVEATEADDDRPFFLVLAPTAPHYPITPAVRHTPNPFDDRPLPTRPNFDEADVADKPLWLRDGHPNLTFEERVRLEISHRKALGSLLAVDDMVVRLMATLEARDELDDTVVVFTSDNGLNQGSHRLHGKSAPYEESIRVPLAIAGPGVRVGTEDRLVTNNDFAPTVLDLAGAGVQDDLDGRSMVPLLAGDEVPWRTDFLIEYNGTGKDREKLHTYTDVTTAISAYGSIRLPPTYRAVRDERWLYIRWYGGHLHEHELYDLAADPFQLDNLVPDLAGTIVHREEVARLRARLDLLVDCAGPSCRK